MKNLTGKRNLFELIILVILTLLLGCQTNNKPAQYSIEGFWLKAANQDNWFFKEFYEIFQT
jgi:hypothetical protein